MPASSTGDSGDPRGRSDPATHERHLRAVVRSRGLPYRGRWSGRAGAMTQTAFLVTGTHGSGSELAARCMAALGVCFTSATDGSAPCQDVLTDERLVRLDESILRDGCPVADPGVPDWGWTETEAFDVGALARHRKEGLSLLGERPNATGCWGLHDPLAAPLLEFWEQLLGTAARFVLVYRAPWSCIPALVKLRPEPFRARADYAVRLWSHHNRRLLDFHRGHPGRCLLVNGDELRADPAAFLALLADRLPSDCDRGDQDTVARSGELAALRDAQDEQADAEPAVRAMLARVWPECDELRRVARAGRRAALPPGGS